MLNLELETIIKENVKNETTLEQGIVYLVFIGHSYENLDSPSKPITINASSSNTQTITLDNSRNIVIHCRPNISLIEPGLIIEIVLKSTESDVIFTVLIPCEIKDFKATETLLRNDFGNVNIREKIRHSLLEVTKHLTEGLFSKSEDPDALDFIITKIIENKEDIGIRQWNNNELYVKSVSKTEQN